MATKGNSAKQEAVRQVGAALRGLARNGRVLDGALEGRSVNEVLQKHVAISSENLRHSRWYVYGLLRLQAALAH